MCNLNNINEWDTNQAVLIGIGKALGGDTGLDGMINQDGVHSPWGQDPDGEVWEAFLGDENAPRKQVILLDQDLIPRYQFQYSGGSLNNNEIVELVQAIGILVEEASTILGDMNDDQNLNVLDVIILVNIVLGNAELDLNGDINGDDGINILDVVLLVNIILGE